MRKLMWITIGVLAACAFCAYGYPAWILYACVGFAAVAVIFAFGSRFLVQLRPVGMLCLGLSVGFLWFHIFDTIHLAEARAVDGKLERVTVIARDYSYRTQYGSAFDGTVELGGQEYSVRVYLNTDQDLEPGNRVIGKFEFAMTAGSGVDEVLYHSGRGTYLMAYQDGNCVVERFWTTPLRDLPMVWRHDLLQIIDRIFPKDTDGFAKALLLGDRSDIDYQTNTVFKVSGISHVIAVSGLHVSILFGLIQMITAKRRFWTALIGIPVVLLFAAVAGFTPSITRAAIMQILVMSASLLNKEYDGPTALSFAALVMVLINPMVMISVSFQLSFACMAGIQLFSEPLNLWLTEIMQPGKRKRKWISAIASGISVTLSAMVLTSALVAVHFETISLVSIITNLATLWVITFVFYGIILACVLAWVQIGVGTFVAGIVAWLIRYVLTVSAALAEIPMAAVYTRSGYIVAWLVFAYVLLAVFLLLKTRPVAVFLAALIGSLCICVGLSWAVPLKDSYRMTVLDVGQGQAILLQSDGKTFLVDCGGDSDSETADTVAETLLSQGIRRLDGIILTHFDQDHAGAVEYLLTRIDTELILMPYALDENGVATRMRELVGDGAVCLYEDLNISYDDTEITVFAPESFDSGNESSLCVLFHKGNCDILITGDRGAAGEQILMKFHSLPQVDVLMVGHHGSKHSTSKALLETVRPNYAFISVGKGNAYGHPAAEILELLEEYGCVVYRTDENGTIIYRG